MPPYYFDVCEAGGLTLDDEGIELRDIVHPYAIAEWVR
jgi:hypothetical protein